MLQPSRILVWCDKWQSVSAHPAILWAQGKLFDLRGHQNPPAPRCSCWEQNFPRLSTRWLTSICTNRRASQFPSALSPWTFSHGSDQLCSPSSSFCPGISNRQEWYTWPVFPQPRSSGQWDLFLMFSYHFKCPGSVATLSTKPLGMGWRYNQRNMASGWVERVCSFEVQMFLHRPYPSNESFSKTNELQVFIKHYQKFIWQTKGLSRCLIMTGVPVS